MGEKVLELNRRRVMRKLAIPASRAFSPLLLGGRSAAPGY
jgi:hypothetical protein